MDKKNLWKALGFSFGIAILGAIVWGMLYTTGWIVGLVAYFTSFVMIKVFNKYYQTSKKWKYAYIVISIIVLNIVASFVSLGVYCADLLDIELSVAFEALFETFSEYAKEFAIDMIIGCVFAMSGIITVIQIDKKNNANNQRQEVKNEGLVEEDGVDTTEIQDSAEELQSQKFCTSCGSVLESGATKCQSCGKDVENN